DQIRHDREGLLVPPEDPVALADAIVRISTEPGMAARLRRGALRRAGTFPFAGMVDAIECAYASAVRMRSDGAAQGGT
ncbi:MAG TPA: hypothetical protein VHH34_03635, partial [Pseudonocardiaceae bacterium]|nr:hypothetical protein [Pseudonocardiaceae bacterium]